MRTIRTALVLLLSLGGPAGAETASENQDRDRGDALKQASLFGASSRVPWRGSQLVLRNSLSVISLDQSAEQTHNPYFAHTWSFRPWWWFTEKIYTRARLDIVRELTDSDVTTYADEAVVEDLRLVAGGSGLWTIPLVGVHLSADLMLILPTSKVSRARTLVMAVSPGLRLSRSFPVLGGLSVGYNLRLTPRFFRYTTAESENPRILSCRPGQTGCYFGTGERNPYLRLSQTADASLKILDWLGVSLVLGHAIDWLYAPSAPPVEVTLAHDDQDRRFLTFMELAVSFRPVDLLEIGVGYSSLHPQLAPDSTYYTPFFNRYSVFFVDLKLQAEGLVARVKRILK